MEEKFKLGQNYSNNECSGSYRTASRLHEAVINPGDTLCISQYITGYGESDALKIQVYISNQVFDSQHSHVLNGLKLVEHEGPNALFAWGATKTPITGHNFKIMVRGVNLDKPGKSSSTFDTLPGTTYIMSEEDAGGFAPFEYVLKTQKNAKPGNHYLSFYLTYFDGEKWACQEEKASFKINNKFEQYGTHLSIMAAIALLVTIFHDGFFPLLESIHDLGKFMLKK